MYWALVVFGALIAIVGTLMLSQATMGVGVVALGCFLGIVARIMQAEAHAKAAQKREAAVEQRRVATQPLA